MKLQSVQALRGIAALLVVVYHARALELAGIARAGSTEPAVMGGLFASGFAGVDLFFVISGFIMVWVTRDASPGPLASADFLFARLTRIYPVWWAGAALGLAYMVVSGELTGTGDGGLISANSAEFEYILKSFLLVPQPDYPVLLIGWTLIHEVYFYIVFAVILLLPRSFIPYALLAWGAVVVAASLLGLPLPIAQNLLTLAVHPMTMEFLFGAAVGLMIASGFMWRTGLVTLISTLWLVAAICLQGPPSTYTLQWGRVLEIGLPCAALVYGVAGLNDQGRLPLLIPALAGAITAGLIFQLFGLDPAASFEVRRDSVILATIIGALAILIVLWAGWLLGYMQGDWLLSTAPFWRRVLDVFAHLGNWSYSIYLFHIFALGILQRLMSRTEETSALAPLLRLGAPGVLDNLLFLTAGCISAVAAGWLGYMIFERPALVVFGWIRRRLFRPPAD